VTSFFHNKKVLIIGGTGTIGQSLLKNILADDPKVVRLFSRDEHKQFELQQTLPSSGNVRYLIGDVRDYDRLVRAMEGIDYVFHTAAMKHVPSCEYNPYEAVQTNIIGTQNVIQASIQAGVKKTIFTSTDKAIAPTNTYGASKLMAERLIASAQYNSGGKSTIFAAVRFGNVMNSRGSVIPLFKNQIINNREITITDMSMTRFMMTLEQATQLTINAMQRSHGGEIFVLKMPVIRLQDLGIAVIRHMSQKLNIPTSDIKIKEIGLRPGEKMYEELMTVEEAMSAYELSDMYVIPNLFIENNLYADAVRAEAKSYNSHSIPPITFEEVSDLLEENKILV